LTESEERDRRRPESGMLDRKRERRIGAFEHIYDINERKRRALCAEVSLLSSSPRLLGRLSPLSDRAAQNCQNCQ